jgi:hypothetical protein
VSTELLVAKPESVAINKQTAIEIEILMMYFLVIVIDLIGFKS